MPNWGAVLKKVNNAVHPLDEERWRYLKLFNEYTNRNVISYYSGFLQKSEDARTAIDDNDKNAFMQAVHQLDKTKGLDLILHTPGGDIAATESIVGYLKSFFGEDIRAFIPQIAMSAGTMIALSCKEIVMGKQSNLGPIDPQYGGISCQGVIDEFEQALKEVSNNQAAIAVWRPIIEKYHP
ncbi:MAG: serine protease, partial [Christensenella sp.]|uniref:SDH family Clp fold serine proteinase n=1 Tax=Christensenella sp. TaxID=1935934 RepID=UPI002B39BB68|nr:serine protease [Christensenella sp.]